MQQLRFSMFSVLAGIAAASGCSGSEATSSGSSSGGDSSVTSGGEPSNSSGTGGEAVPPVMGGATAGEGGAGEISTSGGQGTQTGGAEAGAGGPADGVDAGSGGVDSQAGGASQGMAGSGGASSDRDTTPPDVLMRPEDGSEDLPLDTFLELEFSESMAKAATVASVSIAVNDVSVPAEAFCSGGWQWTSQAPVLTCKPIQLTPRSKISVTVGTTAQDAAGNQLPSAKTFSFTVGVPTPGIKDAAPATGAVRVARSSALTLHFLTAMDTKSVADNLVVSVDGAPAKGKLAWQDCHGGTACSTLIYTFPPDPAYGAKVTWSLAAAARDEWSSALQGPVSGSYTVIRELSQRIPAEGRDGTLNQQNGVVQAPIKGQGLVYVGGLIDVANHEIISRGFLSFDLSGLPKGTKLDPVKLTRATLRVYQEKSLFPKTFELLNSIFFDHVYYDQLTVDDFDLLSPDHNGWSGLLSTKGDAGERLTDVSQSVLYDWAQKVPRTQFRLHFSRENKISKDTNQVDIDSAEASDVSRRPWLDVYYEEPAAAPMNQ